MLLCFAQQKSHIFLTSNDVKALIIVLAVYAPQAQFLDAWQGLSYTDFRLQFKTYYFMLAIRAKKLKKSRTASLVPNLFL